MVVDKLVFSCLVFVKIAYIVEMLILFCNGVWFVSYYYILYLTYKFIMIRIQRNVRLILLCIICTLACVTLFGISAFADTVTKVASLNWQIAQLDDVFADTPLLEDSVAYMPTSPISQQSDSNFSFEEAHYTGGGEVVLLSHQLHPLHAGRSLRLTHV